MIVLIVIELQHQVQFRKPELFQETDETDNQKKRIIKKLEYSCYSTKKNHRQRIGESINLLIIYY